jgi:DNA (cytosine-5)-methyltransferase 1
LILRSLELCAGAGGQALGLEWAGFSHLALVEIDHWACETLRANRPRDGAVGWNVIESDIRDFEARGYRGNVDLLAAGIPCPPFSKAGAQLGEADERNLFEPLIRAIDQCAPEFVLIENVRGLLDNRFANYRALINERIRSIDSNYSDVQWDVVNASDFGVPQLRPRAVGIVMKSRYLPYFEWPQRFASAPVTVGQALFAEMSSRGWRDVSAWARAAKKIAPTLVGGSRKHGGADLGPTRAKREWAGLGVDAIVLADEPPGPNFSGLPRLTVRMAAILQGFPTDWKFQGGKTASYRQIGNAFPPPVARELGLSVRNALAKASEESLPRVS